MGANVGPKKAEKGVVMAAWGTKEREIARARSYSKRWGVTCQVYEITKGPGKGRFICVEPSERHTVEMPHPPGPFHGIRKDNKLDIVATFKNGIRTF